MLDWFWKLRDWLQHAVIAVLLQAVFGLLFLDVWVGAVAGIMFYYGREIRDSEIANPSLFNSVDVLLPWNWTKDSITDFVAPVIACLGIALVLTTL